MKEMKDVDVQRLLEIDTLLNKNALYFTLEDRGVKGETVDSQSKAGASESSSAVLKRSKMNAGVGSKLAVQAKPPGDLKLSYDREARGTERTSGKSSGPKWFDMPAPVVTAEIERDFALLRARQSLDPKQFYKKQDKSSTGIPKFFQIGTIVNGAQDFYSNRATRKQKKQSLLEELLSDQSRQKYLKQKFLQIQEKKASGGRKWLKKKRERR